MVNINVMGVLKTELGARQSIKCFKMQGQHEKQTYFKDTIRRNKHNRNLALSDSI